jgi:hypothetical protein
MQAVSNSAFWDNETDTTHRKGATITATPTRIAYLKHIGQVDSITGTVEEVATYQTELNRLNGQHAANTTPVTLNNTETFDI